MPFRSGFGEAMMPLKVESLETTCGSTRSSLPGPTMVP